MKIKRLGQIAVTVADLKRATEFYKTVLELQFLFQAPPSLAFFACGDVRIMLSPPETQEAAHASILYFTVDDIHASASELRARGVEMIGTPHLVAKMSDHDLWLAGFRDSEGNAMALMCEVKH